MIIVAKLLRKYSQFLQYLMYKLRIVKLRLKYPSLKIKGKTKIGKNCNIVCVDGGNMMLDSICLGDNVMLFCAEKALLKITRSYIGSSSVVVAKQEIIIEKNCEIAEMVVIRDQNHNHNLTNKPISKQGSSSSPIFISSNVWIGTKATILKGVNVGKNSVIGAHSLVNKSFLQESKIVGIPAKRIN